MIVRRGVWLLALLLACDNGSDSEDRPDSDAAELAEADTLQQADTLPPPMPEFPEPRRGHLTTAMTGEYEFELTGSWEAWAGRCRARPLVELIARGEGFGTIVLLATPDSGSPVGSYEVTPGTSGIPESFQARIGVQRYPERRSYVFDALAGEVVVDSLGERLYGRLTARLRGRNLRDTVPFAGVFHDLDVRELGDEWCQTYGQEADTVSEGSAVNPARP